MSWWYENEEEEMKTCKECGNDRCILNGLDGYCLECPECGVNWKEERMEFDKERVFTAANADELHKGDKVIVADNLFDLRVSIKKGEVYELKEVLDDMLEKRFRLNKGYEYSLAYLVERAENCTNCIENDRGCTAMGNDKLAHCWNWKPKTEQKEDNMNWNYVNEGKMPERQEMGVSDHVFVAVEGCPYGQSGYYDFDLQAWFVDGCSEPVNVVAWQKVELPKVEKHYRPFKDVDELVKVWDAKYRYAYGLERIDNGLDMPLIWVREKGCNKSADLITCYGSKGITVRGKGMYFDTLFTMFEFLDGTPCGVEE